MHTNRKTRKNRKRFLVDAAANVVEPVIDRGLVDLGGGCPGMNSGVERVPLVEEVVMLVGGRVRATLVDPVTVVGIPGPVLGVVAAHTKTCWSDHRNKE